MKLLKITSLYPSYINEFYWKKFGVSDKTYKEQKQTLDYDAFGWADFWECALGTKGYEVTEIASNVEILQKKWAEENGINYREDNWLLEIAQIQIQKTAPDILFIDDYSTFSYEWIKETREKCTSIKLVLGWCGAPYSDESVFKAYDVVLSCIPEMVDSFRDKGIVSEHVNHAFDPRILSRIDTTRDKSIDFSFIGQIVRANKYHKERGEILEELSDLIDVIIFSPSYEYSTKDIIKAFLKMGIYDITHIFKQIGFSDKYMKRLPIIKNVVNYQNRPVLPYSFKLKKYMKPPVFGLNMFQTLYDSKVTFNSHIAASPRSASNMRMFETTGVGTCLLTDWKENINDLFEPDKEVVTYKSTGECIEKAKWLIEHPVEREQIAKAGQERTLREHTFEKRAELLDSIIKRELKTK